MIRVLIVAESDVERAGLEVLITADGRLELVATLGDARELPGALGQAGPDVIVFAGDGGAEGGTGLETVLSTWLTAFQASAPREAPALLLLADEIEPGQMAQALRAGSFALLPSGSSSAEIRAAIEAVAAGLVVLHPAFADAGTARSAPSARPRLPGTFLTAREVEVLRLIAAGLANKEIAAKLEISEHTVKFHVASIFNKLDVSNRAEAVSSGMRLGLILV